MKECGTCGGTGRVRRFTGDGYKTAVRTCETCNGDGMRPFRAYTGSERLEEIAKSLCPHCYSACNGLCRGA